MTCHALFCPAPREQGVDLADRVISDAVENIGQIGLRIDAAHLASFDDGVDACGALSTGVGATEQIVFPLMQTSA